MSDIELWARRLERERRARKEAETLLESKSHELYLANKALQQSYDAIAAAKNYTENILRSLMNALIVVTPGGTIQAVNIAACTSWDTAKQSLWDGLWPRFSRYPISPAPTRGQVSPM